MRLVSLLLLALVFAAPAAAAGPRFGLFDLNDLTRAGVALASRIAGGAEVGL